MEVFFYQTANGRSPVVTKLDVLPKQASAHAYELLSGVEKFGLSAPRIVFRQIEGKLWEIKMNLPGTGGYRIFYCMIDKEAILLLHAYVKKTQKAPQKEIDVARNRMTDAINRGVK